MLRNLVVILALVLGGSLIVAAQPREPAAQWFERGQQRLVKDDFDGAIADFTKVIGLNVARSDDNRRPAKSEFIEEPPARDTVTFVSPLVAAAYGGRCLARYRKHHLADAIADCDRALALNPGLTQVHTNLGVMLWVKGDLDGALADFDRVIKVNPKDAQAYEN